MMKLYLAILFVCLQLTTKINCSQCPTINAIPDFDLEKVHTNSLYTFINPFFILQFIII